MVSWHNLIAAGVIGYWVVLVVMVNLGFFDLRLKYFILAFTVQFTWLIKVGLV